ncbi:MAG: FKBP-type peptidyl-prolyl cis-trans isomerase [Myxococcales bacterium]|nr:MAG: FKBP-type peptidyl-prolyl cis-trans isomerase [Myxococcales bacterium]
MVRYSTLCILSCVLLACGAPKQPAQNQVSHEAAPSEGEEPSQAPSDEVQVVGTENGLNAPTNVAAAPPSAERSPTGLAWQVLTPGHGHDHPTATSNVRVHYTGWTTDGRLFDSSVKRGEPATFPLNRVIPGWTEGLQLMSEGEKRRFWIPAHLAYEGQNGPQGTLVFDVELLEILD